MTITVNCEQCEKPIERDPYQVAKGGRFFCSWACQGKWRSINKRGENSPRYKSIKVACDNCGAIITRAPWELRRDLARNFCNARCYGDWRSKHLTGEQLYNYNKVEVPCEQCGQTVKRTPYRLKVYDHTFCSRKCLAEWQSIHQTGENSPRWQGGHEPYYGKNWLHQQRRARKRDSYTCQKCGKSEQDNGRALDVHHIIPFCEFDYAVGEN